MKSKELIMNSKKKWPHFRVYHGIAGSYCIWQKYNADNIVTEVEHSKSLFTLSLFFYVYYILYINIYEKHACAYF